LINPGIRMQLVAEGGGGLAWRGAVVVRGEKRSEKGRRGAWKRRVDLARSDGGFGFGLGVAETGGGPGFIRV
jgi:hypothetical protein